MRDSRVEVVETGQPPVQLLACALCGVLLWDIRAHYRHAHLKAAPAPSSGVDEDKLAEVIHSAHQRRWCLNGDGEACPESRQIARAVAEWLKGQGGESRGDR